MYLKPYDSPGHRVAVLKFVQTIPLKPSDPGYDIVSDTAASLTKFAGVPTLLLWGLRDFVFDKHFLDGFRRALPRATVREFEDANHYVLEDKHEVLVPAIRRFLDAHPLAAGA